MSENSPHQGLTRRIVVMICAGALCAFMTTIAVVTFQGTRIVRDGAVENTRSLARETAGRVERPLAQAMDIARTLAQSFESLQKERLADRNACDAMMRHVMERFPECVGVWTCWEPNAFDGKDRQYAHTPASDATGRYIPYWNRGAGKTAVEPLKAYETPGDGDYYLLAKRSGKETIMSPFAYKIGDRDVLMTSLVVPIRCQGVFVGVAGIDLPLDRLQAMLLREKPYQTGYVSLLSNDGKYVAHLDPGKLGKAMETGAGQQGIREAARAGREYSTVRRSPERGQEVLTFAVPVKVGGAETPWSVVVNAPMDRVMAPAVQLRTICLLAGVLSVIALILLAFLIARSLVRPIRMLSAVSDRMVRGEVDVTVDVNSRDEIGDLARSFAARAESARAQAHIAEEIAGGNLAVEARPRSEKDVLGLALADMIVGLRRVIGKVAESTAHVAATSEHLTDSANQSERAANEIARSMQEVSQAAHQSAVTSQEMARGSEQQARSAGDASGAMENLLGAIQSVRQGSEEQRSVAQRAGQQMQQANQALQDVSRSSASMTAAAQQAAVIAREGGASVEQTLQSIERIQQEVGASAERVKELGRKGQEIGSIIETIEQIAEKTNLLALNAAIEAARAGEHGRGFAVVADEVRKLAESSAHATREITTLIGSVRAEVDGAVQAMETSRREVESSVSQSREAGRALSQIQQATGGITTGMSETQQKIAVLVASLESVQASMQQMLSVVERTDGGVHTMARESDQMAMVISTVASISEETAAGAEQMSASAEEVSASTQNVSASVQEQTATVEEINASAARLAAMAQDLQALVDQFQMEDQPRAHGVTVGPPRHARAA